MWRDPKYECTMNHNFVKTLRQGYGSFLRKTFSCELKGIIIIKLFFNRMIPNLKLILVIDTIIPRMLRF